MMWHSNAATTFERTEAAPSADWPNINGAPGDMVRIAWHRIEAYTAWRFSPRVVTWIVEGPGHWKPDLAPAVISTVETWDTMANAMVTSTLNASPYGGYDLPACGPYRFTATVGDMTDQTVPIDFAEAVRRLTWYLASNPGTPGVRSERISAGSIDIQRSRSESWMASALQNSGAADLLRTYRKV